MEVHDLPAKKLDLAVKAGAAISMSVQGCAALPGTKKADCGLVGLGLKGQLNGSFSGGFNQAPLAVSLSAGGNAESTLSYFLRGKADSTLGENVLKGLTLIGSHPSLNLDESLDLLQQSSGDVAALSLARKQSWFFEGNIKIGREFAVGGDNQLDVGFDVGFKLQESGEFLYSLSRADNGLLVTIQKMKAKERTTSEGFSVEFDLTGLANNLSPGGLNN